MTRQEFTDAVGQLLGVHPGVEAQIDTITRLADAYADTQVKLATRDDPPQTLAWGPGRHT